MVGVIGCVRQLISHRPMPGCTKQLVFHLTVYLSKGEKALPRYLALLECR